MQLEVSPAGVTLPEPYWQIGVPGTKATFKHLGQIGTPDAIRALVEDLSTAADIESQTGFALEKLGPKAIPFLIPLLKDQEKSLLAAQVIAEMDPLPTAYASTWVVTALDAEVPLEARMAALRGIAALGPAAEHTSEALHVLLKDNDPELQKQVGATLRAVRDPIVVVQMAQSCQPKAPQFDFLALDSDLYHLCERGRASLRHFDSWLHRLRSGTPEDRSGSGFNGLACGVRRDLGDGLARSFRCSREARQVGRQLLAR